MTHLKKRVIAGILGLTLALTVVACDSDDDPSNTTPAGDSDTTEPVGS
jgi:hypothetical protein